LRVAAVSLVGRTVRILKEVITRTALQENPGLWSGGCAYGAKTMQVWYPGDGWDASGIMRLLKMQKQPYDVGIDFCLLASSCFS